MNLLYPDIIKLLVEHYLDANDSLALFCTSKIFFTYRRSYQNILLDAKEGLNYCTLNGKLDALKFIYYRRNFDIHEEDEYLFRLSCEHGYLDIARWLIQLGIETNSPINIRTHHDYAFRWSCQRDHLNIAHWLIQLGIETNSPIDIHAVDDDAFEYSCRHGHLNIAQWLIQLGIETNSPINHRLIKNKFVYTKKQI